MNRLLHILLSVFVAAAIFWLVYGGFSIVIADGEPPINIYLVYQDQQEKVRFVYAVDVAEPIHMEILDQDGAVLGEFDCSGLNCAYELDRNALYPVNSFGVYSGSERLELVDAGNFSLIGDIDFYTATLDYYPQFPLELNIGYLETSNVYQVELNKTTDVSEAVVFNGDTAHPLWFGCEWVGWCTAIYTSTELKEADFFSAAPVYWLDYPVDYDFVAMESLADIGHVRFSRSDEVHKWSRVYTSTLVSITKLSDDPLVFEIGSSGCVVELYGMLREHGLEFWDTNTLIDGWNQSDEFGKIHFGSFFQDQCLAPGAMIEMVYGPAEDRGKYSFENIWIQAADGRDYQYLEVEGANFGAFELYLPMVMK